MKKTHSALAVIVDQAHYRIRLRMSAENAAALYRLLPPDAGLLGVRLAPR